MRKAEVDRFALRRPFRPFEVRLVDGRRFQFKKVEEFLTGRYELITVDRKGLPRFISIGLITTIGPVSRGGHRRPRTGSR
jgi:hypothetical protein